MAIPSAEDPAAAAGPASDAEQLIPGLPDEVAEYCLLRLPFPYQSKARSVSSSWNRAISSPSFHLTKNTLSLSLSLPYLFVFAFHRSTFRLQWQAFDPRSRTWFALPPMPLDGDGGAAPLCPPAFACAAVPHRGELFVLGGMRSDTQTPLQTLVSYRASTNSWSAAAPMSTSLRRGPPVRPLSTPPDPARRQTHRSSQGRRPLPRPRSPCTSGRADDPTRMSRSYTVAGESTRRSQRMGRQSRKHRRPPTGGPGEISRARTANTRCALGPSLCPGTVGLTSAPALPSSGLPAPPPWSAGAWSRRNTLWRLRSRCRFPHSRKIF